MGMFRPGGRRTRRLTDFLRKRTRTAAAKRPELDCKSFPQLFRKRGIVFTDTADFTLRTARDGILHFLMVFDTVAGLAEKVVRRTGGEMVKAEGDSLILRYEDADAAVRSVLALDEALQAYNRGVPENEQVHFSYRARGEPGLQDRGGPGRAGRGPAHRLRLRHARSRAPAPGGPASHRHVRVAGHSRLAPQVARARLSREGPA